jgi:hypothetical protein
VIRCQPGQVYHHHPAFPLQVVCSVMENLAARFATGSSVVCLKVLLSILMLPRRNHSLASVSYAVVASRLPLTFLPERTSFRRFRGSFCNVVPGPNFPLSLFDRRSLMTASLTPCPSCTVYIPLGEQCQAGQLPPCGRPSVHYVSTPLEHCLQLSTNTHYAKEN